MFPRVFRSGRELFFEAERTTGSALRLVLEALEAVKPDARLVGKDDQRLFEHGGKARTGIAPQSPLVFGMDVVYIRRPDDSILN